MSATAETAGRIAMRSRRRASKAWYWLAAVVVLLGVGFGVTWGVVSTVQTHDRAEALPRVSAPGTLEVSLAGGADRLIFYEGSSSRPDVTALGLTVTAPDGSTVPVEPYDLLLEYEIAGWAGAPVASFSAPSDGTYVVSAAKAYHDGDISVGDNFVRSQAVNVAGALALVTLSLVAGVVIAVVVAVRRSRGWRSADAS